jgi:hypothetical protein
MKRSYQLIDANTKLNCPWCWRSLVPDYESHGFVCPTKYNRQRSGPIEGTYVEVGLPSPCELVFISHTGQVGRRNPLHSEVTL